ncbi:MAG: hypothetical protein ACE5RI_10120 [Candidatus Nitrosomaritimum yanchengensis]
MKDSKNLNSTAIMALILAYHFNSSDIDDDSLEHKSQKLKANHVSCEGGACDEKNDHTHEHKRKKQLIDKTIRYSQK